MMILCFLLVAVEETTWQWPLRSDPLISGSFGEYRGHRFHMGLDFSTGGVEGKPVHPARPGTVTQIKAGNTGYGRVIYVTHQADSPEKVKRTVYAHLAAFGPKLEAALLKLDLDPKAYFGTKKVEIPIEIGDVIGFSGESGAGLPHLHFEIRDHENRPQDPLSLGFPGLPEDGYRPVLAGLVLFPRNRNTEVNGKNMPQFVPHDASPVHASGQLGVQIYAYIAAPRGNRLGCAGIRIFQGNRLIGSWQPKRLSFQDNQNGGLVHDLAASGFGPTRYAYCFDGRSEFSPSLPGYSELGTLKVEEATNLRIELKGQRGSWVPFSFNLSPDAPKRPLPFPDQFPTQKTALELDAFGESLTARGLGLPGTLILKDQIVGLKAGVPLEIPLKMGLKPTEASWLTARGRVKRTFATFPKKPDFHLILSKWELKAVGLRTLPLISVILEPVDQKQMADQLAYRSQVIRFGHMGLSSRGLQASFDASPPHNQYLGLYAWSFNKGRWRHRGAFDEQTKTWVAVPYLTPMVVAEDLLPPVISRPRVHPYFAGDRVIIPIRDKGSGIDPEAIVLTGPGGKVTFEFDRDRGWLILPKTHTRGPWSVQVSDRSGRMSKQEGLNL